MNLLKLIVSVVVGAVLIVALYFTATPSTAPATAEPVPAVGCDNDLAATWASMKDTLARMRLVAKSGREDRCAAYRQHAEVVIRAREVLARCRSGREREGDLAHMNGAIDDVSSMIARECNGH